MMSRASRHSMSTLAAPRRAAVRATSMATLPPPTTMTRLPTAGTSVPASCASATPRRKSTATETPSASSPGTPARRPPWHPMAT